MRVVFFGTAAFAVPALERVHKSVCLVVTQPDRPSGRGLNVHASPVKHAAIRLGLEVASPESARDPEFISKVKDLNADILLVAAYGQILNLQLLTAAKNGGINLHGSILPLYRGAAPIQRSIIDGQLETGVTLMQMAKGMDTGDIIDIETLTISPGEKADDLAKRLANLAASLAEKWLLKLCAGDYPRHPQNDTLATMAPKLSKVECRITDQMTAKQVYNLFRGLFPSPGAFFQTTTGLVKPMAMRICYDQQEYDSQTGSIVKIQGEWALILQEGTIILERVKPEGKPEMTFSEYVNGARIVSGQKWLVENLGKNAS